MTDYNQRRPLDDDDPDGYLESDRDYLANNNELAVRLLEMLEAMLMRKTEIGHIDKLGTAEIVELTFINHTLSQLP